MVDEQGEVDKCVDAKIKKIKLEPAEEKTIDEGLKNRIAKQIDYYFSDVNLAKDKFMKEQLEQNGNSISLYILSTFNRLAQLTKVENVIIEALKDYNSDYMELDAEKKIIRRKKPIPDTDFLKELEARTVHVSGFPDSVNFEDLHRYCSNHGEVESLSMRKHYKTKQFKGCIHVVFKSDSSAKKILEGEALVFKDRELRRESMDEYHKRKEDMKRSRMERRKIKSKN